MSPEFTQWPMTRSLLCRNAPDRSRTSDQLENLVQKRAYFGEAGVRHFGGGVGSGLTGAPVERFWLMTKHIAGFVDTGFGDRANGDREGVIGVIFCGGHGQADNQGGAVIELPGRKNQKRMDVAHFAAGLGIAVDPDDLLTGRHPPAFCRYHFSAPSFSVPCITSPPWCSGL